MGADERRDHPALPQWFIAWTWWPNEHDDVTTYEGPYATNREAFAAAEARWPLIADEHDAGWTTVPVQPAGRFPGQMRTKAADGG